MTKHSHNTPTFWRDERMPYIELRTIDDGHQVAYAPHAHREWSIGAITQGRNIYINGTQRYTVEAGSLVFMNPGQMHACNPIDNQPWAYYMLYVDTDWLTELQVKFGLLEDATWSDFNLHHSEQEYLYKPFIKLCETLTDPSVDFSQKESQLIHTLSNTLLAIANTYDSMTDGNSATPHNVEAVAQYIDEHFPHDNSIETLCGIANCTSGHLIRSFKKHYGFSPHAYVVNRRIQFAQKALKNGCSIAQAALEAGFSDQPHFQRTFKKHVAATPRQYR